MKRLAKATLNDLRMQLRHGFYHIYALITLLYIVVLRFTPEGIRQLLLPVLIFSDPALLGFFFIGALVLFEKDARSLEAITVTPLRPSEYLLAKAMSLSTLAILASLVVSSAQGITPRLLLLIPIVGLCGAMVVFAGFSLAARHKTFSLFLLESIPILAVIGLPTVAFLGLFQTPFFYAFPSYPALLALKGVFLSGNPLALAIHVLLLGGWAYVFFRLALRSFNKHVRR